MQEGGWDGGDPHSEAGVARQVSRACRNVCVCGGGRMIRGALLSLCRLDFLNVVCGQGS